MKSFIGVSLCLYDEVLWGFQKLGSKRYQFCIGKIAIRFEYLVY